MSNGHSDYPHEGSIVAALIEHVIVKNATAAPWRRIVCGGPKERLETPSPLLCAFHRSVSPVSFIDACDEEGAAQAVADLTDYESLQHVEIDRRFPRDPAPVPDHLLDGSTQPSASKCLNGFPSQNLES